MNMRTLLGLAVSLSILSLPGYAGKKSKEEQQLDKQQKSEEKNTARYDKVKEFAINKYKTDSEFRDKVDADLAEVMRGHSDEAFRTNTISRSRLIRVHEDTWREHQGLYDNQAVQDYINRTGQKLVPPDSEKLYAFRVVPNPVPLARSLSTGTIYVSTGMISMLQSEAQLSYVLAHEMAHVHLEHWKEQSMIKLGEQAYNDSQAKKAGKIALLGTVAGAALGGAIGQSAQSAIGGAALGALGGYVAGTLMNRQVRHIEWDKVQEDQADDMAFKIMLNVRYDVREVPKLYASFDKVAARDARVRLGFLGEKQRIKLRLARAEELIQSTFKGEIELKQKDGFVSSSAEHRNLMAELKRDNGILAFYHDMFEMARTNLSDAVAIRDNDSTAHYFYAKTMKVVGRTDDDARAAKESFYKAVKADGKEQQNYGAHLHLALMLMRDTGMDPKQVSEELQTYVDAYGQWTASLALRELYPPNLVSIQDYIRMYGGQPDWEPKPPDTRKLERFRTAIEFVSRASEAPVPSVPAAASADVAPPPPPAAASEAKGAGAPVLPVRGKK